MALRDASYFPKEVFPLNMGEEAAFERIFLSSHAPLRYFCEQLTGDDQSCEDIVSKLFLSLWQKRVETTTANQLDYVPMPASTKAAIHNSWKQITDASGKPIWK